MGIKKEREKRERVKKLEKKKDSTTPWIQFPSLSVAEGHTNSVILIDMILFMQIDN